MGEGLKGWVRVCLSFSYGAGRNWQAPSPSPPHPCYLRAHAFVFPDPAGFRPRNGQGVKGWGRGRESLSYRAGIIAIGAHIQQCWGRSEQQHRK
jgi:hypothetical protein